MQKPKCFVHLSIELNSIKDPCNFYVSAQYEKVTNKKEKEDEPIQVSEIKKKDSHPKFNKVFKIPYELGTSIETKLFVYNAKGEAPNQLADMPMGTFVFPLERLIFSKDKMFGFDMSKKDPNPIPNYASASESCIVKAEIAPELKDETEGYGTIILSAEKLNETGHNPDNHDIPDYFMPFIQVLQKDKVVFETECFIRKKPYDRISWLPFKIPPIESGDIKIRCLDWLKFGSYKVIGECSLLPNILPNLSIPNIPVPTIPNVLGPNVPAPTIPPVPNVSAPNITAPNIRAPEPSSFGLPKPNVPAPPPAPVNMVTQMQAPIQIPPVSIPFPKIPIPLMHEMHENGTLIIENYEKPKGQSKNFFQTLSKGFSYKLILAKNKSTQPPSWNAPDPTLKPVQLIKDYNKNFFVDDMQEIELEGNPTTDYSFAIKAISDSLKIAVGKNQKIFHILVIVAHRPPVNIPTFIDACIDLMAFPLSILFVIAGKEADFRELKAQVDSKLILGSNLDVLNRKMIKTVDANTWPAERENIAIMPDQIEDYFEVNNIGFFTA